jgi:hypothetical protein
MTPRNIWRDTPIRRRLLGAVVFSVIVTAASFALGVSLTLWRWFGFVFAVLLAASIAEIIFERKEP